MTTLVALATKDALVMGCDSLGTETRNLINPSDLVKDFFVPEGEWKLKTNENGEPILRNFGDLMNKAQMVPFNSMTHVIKLFSLDPHKMGVMTTGISSIGQRTIRSLIREFKTREVFSSGKVKDVGQKLLEFIGGYFEKEFSGWSRKPDLELMIGGYDQEKEVPSICRISVNENKIEQTFPDDNPFGIAFGGQMQEIQRIVFGTDGFNRVKLIIRVSQLFEKYRSLLHDFLSKKGISEELPTYEVLGDDLNLFQNWDLDGFDANWGDFSEQNAIECVNFFVEIMAKSQQFSSRLPTVGGDIHIGLITKDKGFKFISREEYIHEGHATPMEDRHERHD